MNRHAVYRRPVYRRSELGSISGFNKVQSVDSRINLSIKNVACNTTNAVTALARNSYRKYLFLKNPDLAATLFIGFGSPTPSGDFNNLRLLPNEERIFESVVPIDQIFVISTIANSILLVGEG